MAIVRVKPGNPCAVYSSDLGRHLVLNPNDAFEESDPIVQEFPWAFQRDNDGAPVESATARPGERRNR